MPINYYQWFRGLFFHTYCNYNDSDTVLRLVVLVVLHVAAGIVWHHTQFSLGSRDHFGVGCIFNDDTYFP